MATPDDFTGPVNIGNPVEISVGDLAGKIIKMTGSKSKIIHLPLPADDPKQRRPTSLSQKPHSPGSPLLDSMKASARLSSISVERLSNLFSLPNHPAEMGSWWVHLFHILITLTPDFSPR